MIMQTNSIYVVAAGQDPGRTKEHYEERESALLIHLCCVCCGARPRADGKI